MFCLFFPVSAQESVEQQDEPVIEQDTEINGNEESLLLLDEEPEQDTALTTSSGVGPLLRMLLVLAIVALSIYFLVYILKKVARPTEKTDSHLKILASTHLGSNRYVHVVALGSRAWLLGAADNAVTPIAEIQDQELIDMLLLDESSKRAENAKGSFPDFKSIFKRMYPGTKERENIGVDTKNIQKKRDRLRGL